MYSMYEISIVEQMIENNYDTEGRSLPMGEKKHIGIIWALQ